MNRKTKRTLMKNNATISLPVYYGLIIAQFILPMIATSIDLFSTAPELELLDKTLYRDPQNWELAIISIVGVVLLIITIGLCLRQEWARKAYIYTFFPTFLIYFLPYMHWFYMSSYAAIFNDIAYVCAGILLIILASPALYQSIFTKKS